MFVKKAMITGTVAVVALIGGILLWSCFGNTAQASSSPSPVQANAVSLTHLSAVQEDESGTAETETESGASADVRINGTQARWNGEKWEYSSDGGETWTDEAPEGFKSSEDGSFSFRQSEGELEEFDAEAWEQKLDSYLSSIFAEVDDLISSTMPESYEEWGSFVRFGDTIARPTEDGQWEYSADDGETWTAEAPEGFSVSEDGTRFGIGSGEDVEDFVENFNFESFWNSLWPEYFSETSATKTVAV